MTDWTGKQIGKYEIKELLGRGGMGEVYKAFHPALERDVAIKTIHANLAQEAGTVDRFRREAKVIRRSFGPSEKEKLREEQDMKKLSLNEKLALLQSKYRTKV